MIFFFTPTLGCKNPINIKVNIFYSFSTICTTGVSSSRLQVQTAVSAISSGAFRASPGLHPCWKHGGCGQCSPWLPVDGGGRTPLSSRWLPAPIWTTQTHLFQGLAALEWCGRSCLGWGNLGPSLIVCNFGPSLIMCSASPAKQSWGACYSIKKLLHGNLFPCWSD